MEEALLLDPAEEAGRLEAFLQREVEKHQREGAILGLSGGLDSAVVAALAARALGSERVLALIMPEWDSDPQSRRDALQWARSLGIRWKVVGLTKILVWIGVYTALPLWLLGPRRWRAAFVQRHHERLRRLVGEGETPFSAILVGTKDLRAPWVNQGVAYHRAKVRLRMLLLYYHAELENLLVVGTRNKTERMVGLFVKYGDAAADVAPLDGLYKTQVRQLAEFLGVPEPIRCKPPSPDLLPGLHDEDVLGISYEVLDAILWRLEQGQASENIAQALGLEKALVRYVEVLTHRARLQRAEPCSPEEKP